MKLALVLSALTLAGCAGIPAHDLPARGTTTLIASPAAPEETYRRFITGSRACYGHHFEVVGDYFATRQTGRVSVTLRSPPFGGVSSLYVADIAPAPEGASVAVAMHPAASRYAVKALADMRSWIADAPRCTD